MTDRHTDKLAGLQTRNQDAIEAGTQGGRQTDKEETDRQTGDRQTSLIMFSRERDTPVFGYVLGLCSPTAKQEQTDSKEERLQNT